MKIRKAMIIQSQRVILSTAICLSLFSCGKQQQSGFNMIKELPVATLQPKSVEYFISGNNKRSPGYRNQT